MTAAAIAQIAAIEWLSQSVTLPLWGFLLALILPVAYIARLTRSVIERRIKATGDKP